MNFYKQLTSMPLEELAKWIDEHGQFDDSPWMKWFDQRYCSICPAVEIKREDSLHTLGFEPFELSEEIIEKIKEYGIKYVEE